MHNPAIIQLKKLNFLYVSKCLRSMKHKQVKKLKMPCCKVCNTTV